MKNPTTSKKFLFTLLFWVFLVLFFVAATAIVGQFTYTISIAVSVVVTWLIIRRIFGSQYNKVLSVNCFVATALFAFTAISSYLYGNTFVAIEYVLGVIPAVILAVKSMKEK